MARTPPRKFAFKIRPADPEVRPSPVPVPQSAAETAPARISAPQESSPPVSEEPISIGGVFPTSARALAFLGAAAGSGLSTEAACRRSPDGKEWWAETDGPLERLAQLVWASGGRPHVGQNLRWAPLPPNGEMVQRRSQRSLDLARWKSVELQTILAEFQLRTGAYLPSPEVHVLAPGALSQWILRRAFALRIDVRLGVVASTPLGKSQPESSLMLHSLRAGTGNVPASFVAALARLPSTIVAASFDVGGRLLVDVFHRTPLEHSLLAGMIPEGEMWMFGPPDVGHQCVRVPTHMTDGAAFLEPPAIPLLAPPPESMLAKLPPPLPVKLVSRPGGTDRVDAVLLDDQELVWLKTFLTGHPVSEQCFLIPGQGRSLFLSPGGLPCAIPFGIPLVHELPAGLYVELGMGFAPQLPVSARVHAFDAGKGSVVAVTTQGLFRFDGEHLLPAWSLWVGPVPEIAQGISTSGQKLLNLLSSELRSAEGHQASRIPNFLRPLLARPAAANDRSDLLAQATRAEQKGDFEKAAEFLEAAGERGKAGRMYERAALAVTD